MDVTVHHADDVDRLQYLIRTERNAKQRDRYRAVLLALRGFTSPQIVSKLDRSRRFVQEWVYRYRDDGIDALREKPRPGQPTKLSRDLEGDFGGRIDSGARPGDRVCTLRGKQVVQILEREFGATYTLAGAYNLLHRLGFSCLRPRPRHEKNNPKKAEEFKQRAPLLSRASAKSITTKPSTSGSRTKRASASRGR